MANRYVIIIFFNCLRLYRLLLQLVVANLLERRKHEVLMVEKDRENVLQVTADEKERENVFIEQKIVSYIRSLHSQYID